jgi:hypothetical protein
MHDGFRKRRERRLPVGLLPIIGLISLLLSLPIPAVAQSATPAVSAPGVANGDFAGLVDIGSGRSLYLECRGRGSPTVILEAGYRSPATVWSDDLVQPDDPRMMVLAGGRRLHPRLRLRPPGHLRQHRRG